MYIYTVCSLVIIPCSVTTHPLGEYWPPPTAGKDLRIFYHAVKAQSVSLCAGVSLDEQLQHILEKQSESRGVYQTRRRLQLEESQELGDEIDYSHYDARRLTGEYQPHILPNQPLPPVLLGVPSYPSHLPEAEPILPGHTLLRPALGMLKSSLNFPHKEWDDGSGVYGNYDNLGITFDGRNERLRYSTFRRSPSQYLMIEPGQQEDHDTRFDFSPVKLDPRVNDVWTAILSRLIQKSHKGQERDVSYLYSNNQVSEDTPTHSSSLYTNSAPDYFEDKTKRNKIGRENPELLSLLSRMSASGPAQVRSGDAEDGYGYQPSEEPQDDYHADTADTEPTSMEAEYNADSVKSTTIKPQEAYSIIKNKNLFTHIKLSPYAPTMREVFNDSYPEIYKTRDPKHRDYWFFVQDDFQPFIS